MAQEAGKPIKAARTEVERAVFTFTIAAEETTRIPGEYLSLDWQQFTSGRWGIVRRFPLGPIAGITPFNFPLESGGAQSRSCYRRRLSDYFETGAANPADCVSFGGSGRTGRTARRRIQRAAALE